VSNIVCYIKGHVIVNIEITMSINMDRMEETVRLRRMLNSDGRKCERERGRKGSVIFRWGLGD